MTDYWSNLDQLRADGRRVLRWIERQGVVVCCDLAERERAKEYLFPVFQALEEVVRAVPLSAIYLYRQADQPDGLQTTSGTPMRDVDGIAWNDVTTDRGELHAIGLSCEAIDKGAEYFQMIFLHELAHIQGGGDHSLAFHQQLDRLISRFNKCAGGHVVNDYCGRQMRHDSRAYDPLKIAGKPPAPHIGGRAFRTEEIHGNRKRT